jgi:predicted glycoside hydrolase/deacetylase ChbG (UPF0249 family)
VQALPRQFVLCADDFAISVGASRAALDLIDARRLTAVSAMASAPAWPEHASELKARRGHVAIGLHLDLTFRPFGGRAPPFDLRRLIVSSLAGRLDIDAVATEFERQFSAFESALGARPDHVDGHHHAHALPQVRVALLEVLARRYGALPLASRPLVRNPADSPFRSWRRGSARAKALTLVGLCAGFGARVNAAGFPTNVGFAGFSSLDPGTPFDREFAAFLKAPGPRHLVMCHPGVAVTGESERDPIAIRRSAEYASLMDHPELLTAMLRVQRADGDEGSAFATWLAN